jgi:hypothetical protein
LLHDLQRFSLRRLVLEKHQVVTLLGQPGVGFGEGLGLIEVRRDQITVGSQQVLNDEVIFFPVSDQKKLQPGWLAAFGPFRVHCRLSLLLIGNSRRNLAGESWLLE